ncbi:putative beta-1,3-galactosyltransferase 20 [Dorcoceras hygrometricum]|uniref:Putative beta-1,3-galactosyltransferase 20 n=1 Tax=Dorcoceras hygrometricum TaxID=472368 RepID=A0A2Z7CDE2_9LAMI|nr:putative beta-1,3-galactosyltransferase 20 [Dorcoceras hygrometricum]
MSYQLIQTTSFAMHPVLIEYNVVALDWMYKLPAALQLLYRSSSILRLFLASVPAGPFAPADLSSFAEYDVVTNDIIIDGPLRCSSWFSFDVPAGPSSYSSTCSWFISFQLIHFAPAGSTWPPPDFEHLT